MVPFLYRIYFYALLARGMIGDDELKRLTAGRWLLPLMAQLAAEDGSRFAAMLARLGLSRSALAASLAIRDRCSPAAYADRLSALLMADAAPS